MTLTHSRRGSGRELPFRVRDVSESKWEELFFLFRVLDRLASLAISDLEGRRT